MVAMMVCWAGGLAGCGPRASGDAQRYELQGTVVSLDRRGETLTIAHHEIPGYMEAMTMPFKTKDAWVLDEAHPGDRIQATLVVDGLRSWLEEVRLMQDAPDPAATHSAPEPRPGDAVPDFALVNQDGRPISLKDYRGRALVITFIYTRCPLPDYCPFLTGRFVEIGNALRKDAALYDRTHLLSISIDPEYDTPRVLREYGAPYTGESGARTFSHWEFATGKPEAVKQVATWFGLQYWPDAGQIVHSLRTAVVAPDGRLVKLYHGNEWQAAEVVADLQGLKPASAPAPGKDAAQQVKPAAVAAAMPGPAGAAGTYYGVGVVESIGEHRTTVQIQHEEIKGLMPAMSMPFEVKSPALLAHLAPGDRVRFTLQEMPHGLVITELRKE